MIVLLLIAILVIVAYGAQSAVKVVIRPVDENGIIGPQIVVTKRRYQEWLEKVGPILWFVAGLLIGYGVGVIG